MPVRRGITIAEVIVTLVLGSIVIGLVAKAVTAQRRSERTIAGASQSASIVDETVGVLASAIGRVSSADTVRLRGDTAIDLDLAIGVGLACVAGGDSLVIIENGATARWESLPDSGDTIDALSAGVWSRAAIVSAATRTASGSCAGAQRVLRIHPRLFTSTELPLVRVTRRTRFMVYRGGDGAWWLGERTCSASAPHSCSAAQPVSGPLAGSRALRFAVDTANRVAIIAVSATAGTSVRSAVLPLRP